jgi:hypothetical protein
LSSHRRRHSPNGPSSGAANNGTDGTTAPGSVTLPSWVVGLRWWLISLPKQMILRHRTTVLLIILLSEINHHSRASETLLHRPWQRAREKNSSHHHITLVASCENVIASVVAAAIQLFARWALIQNGCVSRSFHAESCAGWICSTASLLGKIIAVEVKTLLCTHALI